MPRRDFDHEADLRARVHLRIASGFYNRPDVLDATIDRLLTDLARCPLGDGNGYRRLVASYLPGSLAGVVDETLVKQEFSTPGGRVDIVMPLRIEALAEFELWQTYARRYEIECLLVETKNCRRCADVPDVRQLDGYLRSAGLGRFGLLVHREGCTRSALDYLCSIAVRREALILPFNDGDLAALARAAVSGGAHATMRFIRRRAQGLFLAA